MIDNPPQHNATVIPLEQDPGTANPFTRAPMLYALALLVAEPALGISGISGWIDKIFAA